MLHKNGIAVTVPDPARFAVHKLIVATRRRADGQNAIKRDKDIGKRPSVRALQQTRRTSDLALAYTEAWERGAGWQDAIRAGAAMLQPLDLDRLATCLSAGGKEIGEDVVLPV